MGAGKNTLTSPKSSMNTAEGDSDPWISPEVWIAERACNTGDRVFLISTSVY